MDTLYSLLDNSYWFVAIFGTVVFGILFVMTIMGLSHDGADLDGDGIPDNLESGADFQDVQVGDALQLNFLSVKSIVAFFTFYGWGGVCFRGWGWGGFAMAIASGLLMAVVVTLIIAFMLKMQQVGNVTQSDIIGSSGTVYLSIPGQRQPGGKVTVTLTGCTREVAARADEAIASGEAVVIQQALDGGAFLVKKA